MEEQQDGMFPHGALPKGRKMFKLWKPESSDKIFVKSQKSELPDVKVTFPVLKNSQLFLFTLIDWKIYSHVFRNFIYVW